MKINSFKHSDWIKIWEGGWSFLTCSHFGDQYTKEAKFGGRPFSHQSIIFVANGRSSGWMRQSDRDELGNLLAKRVVKNPELAKKISGDLKKQARSFLKFMEEHKNTEPDLSLYKEFWKRLLAYYKPHMNTKFVVDYLSPDLLKKHLPYFESARLAAEPVLNKTEDFMHTFAKSLAKKAKVSYKLLLCLTKEEMLSYLAGGKLPKKSELEKRNKKAVFLHNESDEEFLSGGDVQKIQKLVEMEADNSELKGAIAYTGKASGIVRIVDDPAKVKVFNKGDILIAGSTRPEFLPIMRKAAAFVTDAGGILSHAAIVAREMKKSCIIGTVRATKVFKDGERIYVDADKGTVKKVS